MKALPAILFLMLFVSPSFADTPSTLPQQNLNGITAPQVTSETETVATTSNLSGTPWKDLKTPAGTKLRTTKYSSGAETRTLVFPSNVTISDNGLSVDNSGHGAVTCVWEIAIAIRAELGNCSPSSPEDESLKKKFDHFLVRIDDFIVANSLTPVTKDQLQLHISNELLKAQNSFSALSNKDREKECASGLLAGLKEQSKSNEAFDKEMDDLLSVPRPPVLNPCL